MTKRALLLLPLALAACNKGIELQNVSTEEVAKATENVPPLEPGEWKVTPSLADFKVTNVPDQQAQMMRQMMEMMMQPFSECLNEQLAKERLGQLFGRNDTKGAECRYQKFSLKGEDFDWVLECKGGDRPKMTMKGKGKFTKTDFSGTVEVQGAAPSGQGEMQFSTKLTAKREGACKPGQPSSPSPFAPPKAGGPGGEAGPAPAPQGANPGPTAPPPPPAPKQ